MSLLRCLTAHRVEYVDILSTVCLLTGQLFLKWKTDYRKGLCGMGAVGCKMCSLTLGFVADMRDWNDVAQGHLTHLLLFLDDVFIVISVFCHASPSMYHCCACVTCSK